MLKQSPAGRLAGKLALVTGSTQGLGTAIARRFVAEGARIVVTGRNQERGEAVAKGIGGGTLFIPADLERPDEARRLGAEALAALGGLDILVNSAGLPERSDLKSFTVEQFDRLFHVNVLAPLLLAQAAHPALAARRGVIINVGSVNAYAGGTNLLIYAATKGALMTATKNLAGALAHDRVRAHVLNIGWTDTEGERTIQAQEGQSPDFLDSVGRRSPMGRLILPAEVAAACVWLASDEAEVFSGIVLDLMQSPRGSGGRRPSGGEKKD
jgi:NAD(P)-dependent dehydrogenase (short-subunit alcohol dehydrogenase family)